MSDLSSSEGNKSNSSLLLILLSIKKFPRLFKKLPNIFKKFETNFLTGVVVGALFSLLVNLITNQIGEQILRQKSLEALEIEINDHHSTNIGMINFYNSGNYKKGNLRVYIEHRYSNNVWRSLASTTFFYSLPPKTQGVLLSYYSNIIDGENSLLSNNDQIVRNYQTSYITCQFVNSDCAKEMDLLNKVSDFYNTQQASTGTFVDKYDYDISKVFHPTMDRLSNPLLSFLMGKEALKSLALPWKESK
jgi:hypothetical protein